LHAKQTSQMVVASTSKRERIEGGSRSQREKLLPYVGKYVRATGTAYQLKGTRAIVIKEIAELKDVKLNTKLGTD
jgi:hypothetical protein